MVLLFPKKYLTNQYIITNDRRERYACSWPHHHHHNNNESLQYMAKRIKKSEWTEGEKGGEKNDAASPMAQPQPIIIST